MIPFLTTLADAPSNCVHSFLGLIPWFQYLNFWDPSHFNPPQNCVLNLDLTNSGNWNQIWLIGVALLDDLLRIAGFLAFALVIWGGIRYLTSQGEPENIKGAQSTILNALIGLVIALVSTTAVNYIGNQLGGTNASGLPNIAAESALGTILNVVYGIVGSICVLMIALGGFKYVTSRGEPQNTAKAKDTILYALIGVAVVITAFSITNFILIKVGG